MDAKTTVASVTQWLDLPLVSAPSIGNEREKGAVMMVLKVGFLAVSQADCAAGRVSIPPSTGNKCILPTALIEMNGSSVLHRLPTGLANWAIDCVALAEAGKKLFPTQVEFGELRGAPYAEFLPQRLTSH